MTCRGAWFLTLALASGCGDPSQDSPTISIGLSVSEPVFAYGLSAGEELVGITGAVLRHDTLAIANGGFRELTIVDIATRNRSAAGRGGTGPGEFQWMLLRPDCKADSLLVADAGQARVSMWSLNGSHGRTVALGIGDGSLGSGWSLLGRLVEGDFLVAELGLWPASTGGGNQRLPAHLVAYDTEGRRGEVLHKLSGREIISSRQGTGPAYVSLPFLQRPVLALACERVYYVEGPEPILHSIEIGSLLNSIERQARKEDLPIEPRVLTRTEYHRWMEWRLTQVPPAARRATQEYYEAIFEPWVLPPVVDLLVDDHGRLWAELNEQSVETRRWLVRFGFGSWGSLQIPPDMRILDVHGDTLTVARVDSLGVEYIELRTLLRSAR